MGITCNRFLLQHMLEVVEMKKIVLFASLILFVISAGVQAAPMVEKVWVISVGVSKYNQSFHPLLKCADTAKAFADAIRKSRPLTTEVVLLTTDSEDENLQPTSVNVLRALDRLKGRVKPNDLLLFYFGGHGVEQNGQQYLLTRDADLSSSDLVQRSTIALADLRKRMDGLNTNGRLLILDACRETVESLKSSGGVGGSAAVSKDFLVAGAGWSAGQDKASGTFFGCHEGQKVYHGQEGSFFGNALVDGLSGKARDNQGQVTVKSLSEYVSKSVPEAVSREFGGNTTQKPMVKGQNIGAIVLRPSPGFVAIPAFDGDFGEVFAKAVQTYLGESGEVNLVNRMNITSAIKELKLQESGMTDSANAQKLGKFLNAKYVLAGSSAKEPGNKLNVSVQLVVVQSGQVVPGISAEQSIDPDNWKPGIQALSQNLLGKMRGDAGAPASTTEVADAAEHIASGESATKGQDLPVKPVENPKLGKGSSYSKGDADPADLDPVVGVDKNGGKGSTDDWGQVIDEPLPPDEPIAPPAKSTGKTGDKAAKGKVTKFSPVGKWLGTDNLSGNQMIVIFLANNTGSITAQNGIVFPFKWKVDAKKDPMWLDYTVFAGYVSQDFKCLVKVVSERDFTLLISEGDRATEWNDDPLANTSRFMKMD